MKVIGEPFLHFLVIGGLVFSLHSWRKGRESGGAGPRIEIGASTIESLRSGYERQFRQAPDEEVLRGLVAEHLREEVFYREALALGLDRNDTIVRRRLAQKMEFLSSGITEAAAPDAGELESYFASHGDRYTRPGTITFRHVYFSRGKRDGGTIMNDLAEALAALRSGSDEESLGDGFLHGFEFAGQEVEAIGSLFGKPFAEAVGALPTGTWEGPVESEYGWHVVKVEERGERVPLPFAEVRSRVMRDWIEERCRLAEVELFDRLRDDYVIVIDEAALKRSATVSTAQR